MTWLDQLKARLKAATASDDNVLEALPMYRHAPTDLDKAIRIIECYERVLKLQECVAVSTVCDGCGMGMTISEDQADVIEALAEAEKIKKEAIAKAREGLK